MAAPSTPHVFNPASGPNGSQKPKPQTSNACVGTEDLPYNPPAQESAGNEAAADPQSEKKSPPPDIDEDDGLAMLDIFASFFFWLVKSILFMPVKALLFTINSLVALILLSVLWLQLVEYHEAGSMGASIDFAYNRPGIV